MELEDQLRSLLASCTWVRDADTALRVVPALGADLPVLTVLSDAGGRACLPVACASPVVDGVTEVLRKILPDAIAGKREPIHEASRQQLLDDPLVPVLAGLMIETLSDHTLHNDTIPVLTMAWAAASVMSGGSSDTTLTTAVRSLHKMSVEDRAGVLACVSWSLNGRLAAAGALLRRAGYRARVGGLSRALLTTPLALCMPLGSLRTEDDYALAARTIGVDVPPELLAYLRPAVDAAFASSSARVPQRPVDLERASLQRVGGENPLFSPGVGPRVVAMLPELIDAKALAAAGLPANIAAGLCDPRSASALASAWDDLLSLLLRWDVLSALIAAVQPLRRIRGRWRVDAGALPTDVTWSMLSPRGSALNQHTVVAVRLSIFRARARHAASKNGLAHGAADRIWSETAASLGSNAATLIADHGIAVFQSPSAALAFSFAILPALRSMRMLELKGLGEDVSLPSQKNLGIGVATGVLYGGTDGRALSVGGPAVADAIGLAGIGPLEVAHSGPVRSAGEGPSGFHNSGIVADDSTLQLLLQGARDANSPLHVQGEGGMAGGIGTDFKNLPFRAWWEFQDHLIAALSTSEAGPGSVELMTFSVQDFVALYKEDATKQKRPGRAKAAPPLAAPPPPAPEPEPLQPDPFSAGSLGADPFSAAPEPEAAPAPAPQVAGGGALAPDPFQSPSLPPPQGMPGDDEDTFSFDGIDDDPFSQPAAPVLSLGEDDDEDDEFGFESEPEPEPPMMMLEDEDDDEIGEDDFSFSDPPAPPMMEGGEEEIGFELPDAPEAPMLTEPDDEDGFDFALPGDDPAPPMLEDEDAFALPDEEDGFGASGGPAPPLMLDDEDEDEDDYGFSDGELGFTLSDDPEPPMITEPEDEVEAGFEFALPGDDPAPPMVSFEDDELDAAPDAEPPTMTIEDDDEDDEDDEESLGFGLLEEPAEDGGLSTLIIDDDDDDFMTDMPTQQVAPLAAPMLLEDEPSGLFEPLNEPAPAPAPSEEPELLVEVDEDGEEEDEEELRASAAFLSTDIAKMFRGYVVVGPTRGTLTFGLLDDQMLRDAHAYPSSRNPHNAYVQFLMDKMREGFVPQVHRTQNIEGRPSPLDMVHLEAAYNQMMGR